MNEGVPRLTWGITIPLRDGIELCATLHRGGNYPSALCIPFANPPG